MEASFVRMIYWVISITPNAILYWLSFIYWQPFILLHSSCVADNALGRTKKYVEVSGRPGPAEFLSPAYSGQLDRYNLTWSIESIPPLQEIKLLYRKLMVRHSLIFILWPTANQMLLPQALHTFIALHCCGYTTSVLPLDCRTVIHKIQLQHPANRTSHSKAFNIFDFSISSLCPNFRTQHLPFIFIPQSHILHPIYNKYLSVVIQITITFNDSHLCGAKIFNRLLWS